MNRPILFVTASLMLGIAAAQMLNIHYSSAILAAVLIAGTYRLFIKRDDKFMWLLFACLGMLLFSFQNSYFAPNNLKNFKNPEAIKSITASVISDPESNGERAYFYAEVISLRGKEGDFENVDGKIRVTLEKSLGFIPEYGDVVVIKGKLRAPEGPKNPGEFDYQKYLALKQVYYTVYAKDSACEKTGANRGNWFFRMSYKAKERLVSLIYSSLPETEAKILDGLMLGNQRAIPDDTYDKFKITGTVHILAVSGMNVGLIAFFVFLLLKLLKVNRKICALITIILITGFMIITGAGASIIRATIMSYFILFGIIIERDVDVYSSLSAAALLILLFNPSDLFDAGFQMSFLATAGIVYFMEWANTFFPKMPEWIRLTLVTTLSAQIFLTPVMINTFHQLSLISVLANMVIVPLSGTISIIGYAMWLFGLVSAAAAKIFGASIWVLVKLMMLIVDGMVLVPYAAISIKTLPWLFTAAYYMLFMSLPHRDVEVKVRGISLKYVLCGVLCFWFVLHVAVPAKAALYCPSTKGINAVFIQTKDNKKILLLANDSFRSKTAVKNSVVPFLRNLGINNIDTLITYALTEKGNADALMRNFRVKSVYADRASSGPFKNPGLIEGEFYFKEGKGTFINLNQDRADITSGESEFVFVKNTDPDALKRQGTTVYLCGYDADTAVKFAENNMCVVNSDNSGMFRRPKTAEIRNVWDTAESGLFYKPLK